MSGFFLMRRAVILEVSRRLSRIGFKILLDIFASSPRPLRYVEIPYTFRPRHAGESKLDTLIAWEYLMLLLDKRFGRVVPVRFLAFSLVGLLGVPIHLGVLGLAFRLGGASFAQGEVLATLAAMTANFAVNNTLTYRDAKLKGLSLLRGWATFCLFCGFGAAFNVGVGTYLFNNADVGWVNAALAGVLIGTVWNYALTSTYTWSGSC